MNMHFASDAEFNRACAELAKKDRNFLEKENARRIHAIETDVLRHSSRPPASNVFAFQSLASRAA